MSYYNRKSPRIKEFDYSQENYYFITVCAYNRKCLFGSVSELNRIREIVKHHIENLDKHYDNVKIDKYVVMPNHIHMILILSGNGTNDVQQIIGQLKSGVTREIRNLYPNIKVWQRSFHDHIIRSQQDYERIWLYIEGNPQCWAKDCFYVDQSLVRG